MWKYVREYINHIIVAFAFAIIAAVIYERYHDNPQVLNFMLYISIIAIVAVFIVELRRRNMEKKKALKAIYTFIGKSSSLKPEDVLGIRPFNPYYYRRPEDDTIDKCLKGKNNVLIIGCPLSGKTRAVYEALTKLSEPQDIVIPKCTDINLETFRFLKNTKIAFIDDLQLFVRKQNFQDLLNIYIQNNVTIVATCQSAGMEFKKVQNRIKDWETIFKKDSIIEFKKIDEEKGKDIARKINKNWDVVKFDGTVGSIFVPLTEIKRRFEGCDDDEKTVLLELRDLYICGIYDEKQVFTLEWIKIATKRVGLVREDYKWKGLLRNLKDKELIVIQESKKIQAEEVYLEDIFKPPVETKILDVFEEKINTFAGTPDALFRLGCRAYDISYTVLENAKYVKIAIKAYKEVIKCLALGLFPIDYAITQTNLGSAYSTLGEKEDRAENCKEAINVYKEALKVREYTSVPTNYAMVQYNLGGTYCTLAEEKDKVENCKESIRAYEKALKVYKRNFFPIQYAMTKYNLGNAYMMLSGEEDNVGNCEKAIEVYEEALKVREYTSVPTNYAAIQCNLGGAYCTIGEGEVGDKPENCKEAINACEEALKIFTPDRFQMQYELTLRFLVSAYTKLLAVENKPENCKKAIDAYKKALEIYTPDRFSNEYMIIKYNLGNSYWTLTEVEGKAENCKKAIKAYKDALKVFNPILFPEDYAKAQNNLDAAYRMLAVVEDKTGNGKKA